MPQINYTLTRPERLFLALTSIPPWCLLASQETFVQYLKSVSVPATVPEIYHEGEMQENRICQNSLKRLLVGLVSSHVANIRSEASTTDASRCHRYHQFKSSSVLVVVARDANRYAPSQLESMQAAG